ncbi:NADPH-dependent FMN reductase [Methylotenera oryzisoli]|jgi:FMN reductase|uniref:NADPH-dependent FMN reductase n=1 Tax=Methylotenera oryzisoli TaxID=2080758 RepID=A0A4Y9VSK5_9PROT|nr:NAD(P)H-dependent oxidoreductase [Methylotenera oryzisoli]TFW72275.1 NADPH-dependent FMN reductase [Methylotenera oryzisoli]
MKVVAISGSLSAPSRTKALVENILNNVTQKVHAKHTLIDIAQFAPELGSTVTYNDFPKVLFDAYAAIAEADLIIIGTPVYKASYTGLLKHFFDLLDPKLLVGKVAVLAATGGTDQHALVLEYQLRPLVSFFGVTTAPTAIYARDNEFIDYRLHSEAIEARVNTAVNQALNLLENKAAQALAA